MSLIPSDNKSVKIAAISAIVLVVVFNFGYWVVWPSINRPAQDASQMVPMPNADGTYPSVEPTIVQADLVNPGQILLAGSIIVGIMVIGAASWIGFVTLQKKQGSARDGVRKRSLQDLAEGMENYKRAVGHYPISAKEQRRLLPAVGMGYEWEDLGFPNANEMRQYIKNWPIVDPSVSFDQRDQGNQFLYYPIGNGQNFALYAHLEAVSQAGPDYSQIDGLPRAWGQYNFRIGTPMQVQAAPPAPPMPVPPVPVQEESPRETILPAGESSDRPSEASQPEIPRHDITVADRDKPLSPEEIMKLGS